MRKIFISLVLTLCLFTTNAQYRLQYESFSIGGSDTSRTIVLQSNDQLKILSGDKPQQNPIPGLSQQFTFLDYRLDTIISQLYYSDTEQYYCGYPFPKREYQKEGTEKVNGYVCTKYSITLFSNKIELWVTEELPFRATASSGFADLPGVLVKSQRNGSAVTQLCALKKDKKLQSLFPQDFGTPKDAASLSQLQKDKLVITYPIFQEEQICFNPSIEKPTSLPYDSVLHFANGTLILKKMQLGLLPDHYKIFAEVTEYSNGDAYDRTGSIFLLPNSTPISMIQALVDSVGILPYITDKAGNRYHGMVKTADYLPPVELIRFFTPFGVRHYNEYRALSHQEWEDAVYYKQDITDFRTMLQGDVYIGAFIGNYDKGGHKLSLTLKAYPENDEWTIEDQGIEYVQPLFNTCNIMEMAGQNYGRFFGTDSLTTDFIVTEEKQHITLRYTTTGHGGWDQGDEFVPKANTILIDGEPRFVYTPWRCDCGTYRTSNPASGNFWNGMSSSDYSRSGWCPGTATQPTFFDLSDLKPGKHTITIAIPQGEPEGNSFSAWSVSGVLIHSLEKRD